LEKLYDGLPGNYLTSKEVTVWRVPDVVMIDGVVIISVPFDPVLAEIEGICIKTDKTLILLCIEPPNQN